MRQTRNTFIILPHLRWPSSSFGTSHREQTVDTAATYAMKMTDKATILVLPGMHGTGELLHEFVAQMEVTHPVRVINYPTVEPLGYRDLTAFVMERAPTDRFVIVGESFSGPIAIEIAAMSQGVSGLVLASSFAHSPIPSLIASVVHLIDFRGLPDKVISSMLLGSKDTPELRKNLMEAIRNVPREIVRRRVLEILQIDKRNKFREVTCPVLILHGRRDRIIRKFSVNALAASKPDCQVEWLDAPHMLLETCPREAADLITRFCNGE